ncbi:ABC transporter substrate-binding protein [Radiobacillus kanasensis]|uniref:ABC transporter substrate-binding protein n=1 Tax=Radiobacillus kanasensis TaxID=2844358 RepID=UPI001E53B877|nr:ABC transporter substrate-binding protein [Radiobacillus kanasensis]UFT98637.1 ABC transporter substrate-binding protein [Radiobacillus kanasensis]
MKRSIYLPLTAVCIISILVVIFVNQADNVNSSNGKNNNHDQLLQKDWSDILSVAKGKTVHFYMWGGNEFTNRYIDEWVAPRLKEKLDITMNRVPVKDINDTINKLVAEKQAGKTDGSVDMMWINGENFLSAKQNQLLWGSFSSKLPNVQKYVDQDSPSIKYDFGEPTNGLESPWSKAQFVFIYDSSKIKNPPKSASELKDWVKEHPGKFTYPAPPDFTGSAFIRNMLYETTGGADQYLMPVDEQKGLEKKVQPLWTFLNEIEPYLWREGKTYPETVSKLDQLYADGAVWMTMSYDPSHAANGVKNGNFPETTRTFVLEEGTLSNTSYLSIPFNAKNKAAAMATINFMQSPSAQIAKADPEKWGALMAIEPDKLSTQQRNQLEELDKGEATLPTDVLTKHRVPEIPADYVDLLEERWLENVAK